MDDIKRELIKLFNYDNLVEFKKLINERHHEIDLNLNLSGIDILLYTAASNAKLEYVRVLVNNGADIHLDIHGNALRRTVDRCVHIDIYYHESSDGFMMTKLQQYYDTIVYLLESGVNTNSVGSDGDTSLMVICKWNYREMVIPVMKQIIMILLDHGADRSKVTPEGLTLTYEQVAREQSNREIADYIRDYESVPGSKGVQMDDV